MNALHQVISHVPLDDDGIVYYMETVATLDKVLESEMSMTKKYIFYSWTEHSNNNMTVTHMRSQYQMFIFTKINFFFTKWSR